MSNEGRAAMETPTHDVQRRRIFLTFRTLGLSTFRVVHFGKILYHVVPCIIFKEDRPLWMRSPTQESWAKTLEIKKECNILASIDEYV